MGDLSAEVILFLVLASLVAGFVDAVVGGGGLVQLPALLVGLPGASVVQIAATNKLASFCGRRSARRRTCGASAPTRARSCR